MNKCNNGKKIKWLSDSVLIFISPLIAYLLLYVYEIGYANYFEIPLEFVSLDISKILIILGDSWSFLLFLIFCFNLLIILFYGVDNFIIKEIKPMLPMIFLCCIMFFLYGRNHWRMVIPSIITILVIAFLVFLLPLLTQRSKKTYKEKLEAQAQIERETQDMSTILHGMIGRKGVLLLLTLIIAINLSYNSGMAKAMNKQDFLTITDQSDTIILNKYGDYFICSKIDNENKSITQEYSIINIYDEPTKTYTIRNLAGYTVE